MQVERHAIRCPQPLFERRQCRQSSARFELTFPHHRHAPPEGRKLCLVPLITGDIGVELPLPELLVARRRGCEATSRMPVPEAAMHQHDRSPFRQDDVRPSRQPLVVKAKAEPGSMKRLPNDHFRLRVAPPYGGHHPGSDPGLDNVHRDEHTPGNRRRIA